MAKVSEIRELFKDMAQSMRGVKVGIESRAAQSDPKEREWVDYVKETMDIYLGKAEKGVALCNELLGPKEGEVL
jgi:hypothetical protein